LDRILCRLLCAICVGGILGGGTTLGAKTSGKAGFTDHDVAAPVSRARGVTAAVDGEGKPVVLVWMFDHRACKSMLVIDAETGETQEYATPRTRTDSPFAVLHSSDNKFYSQFGATFLQFDPTKRAFTFSGKVDDRVAMSMTEDKRGVVWAATYPRSHLAAFDPKTRKLTNYGSINKEDWRQYPRSMAADDLGWVYVGIGNVRSHIVAFHVKTGRVKPIARDDERAQGSGYVYKGKDGKVYGKPSVKGTWYALAKGKATPLKTPYNKRPAERAPIRTGAQESVFRKFPDGSQIEKIDVPEKRLEIRPAKGRRIRRLTFDYKSEGSHILSLTLGPDDRIYGSTGHPLRVYRYDPETDSMTHDGLGNFMGHLNAVTVQRGRIYGARYGGGVLYEYDPAKPWADAARRAKRNPVALRSAAPTINRPHALLAHPDGRHLIMAGTPGYGRTGGGLMFHDLKTGKSQIITHEKLLRNLSTQSLIALPDGNLLGGTTVAPGTGGRTLAKVAELYVLDFALRKIVWREAILPGVREIRDLLLGPDGLVYGIADGPTFFASDPKTRKVVHKKKLTTCGAVAGGQAPRVMALGPDKMIYALFQKAVVRITPGTFARKKLATPPVDVQTGVALHKGRIYFTHASHLWSYKVPGLP